MELLQLKYFQTVAFTEHMSKAAKLLNIAQPSLSLTIRRLEDELGTKLFERKGRNIQLSSSGKILLKHVNRIFTEIENAQIEIQSEEHQIANAIRISISNARFLSKLISEYINRFPESKIQQGIGVKSGIMTSLKKGDIDLGIASHPIQDEEIESCVLINEDIVLVLPSNHRYADETEISLSQVADEPFISLANNEEYSGFTTSLCEKAGFSPNNAFEVDSNLLVEIIKLDQGVALLPISVCRTLGLHYIKIADNSATYSVGLSWIRHKVLSSSVRNFRDFIISYYKDNYDMFKV
ncbi:LysR family transcriptional regulator [Bacillus atrophaeus]|uniref:LysR family transcriptional regulator n=1 Tax=Bacillus atrophaeus TaxID=1452 RepID=UPI00228142CD|nr:LysR family transcriptional regulator [Bacillus atrophaeus]MCY8841938.1 LysR family transcriptional regulator [Bacillus atrophaeus]MEC0804148.1 LysR family transcriptional regulator [Bacillus atrophaeus]MEC0852065.1 LysR family transcriptional regulator [Bacillus atrophaeus]MEC0858977.1 LysR family transcriptional regulator [Bacillus atrophaeus]MEC0861784.1 LysR family transcriptional regulator [Bacillus atrophaeus]